MSASNWRRVTAEQPCPVCGKPDWCLVTGDNSVAVCSRTESDRPVGEAGWLHLLTDRSKRQPQPRRIVVRSAGTVKGLTTLARACQAAADNKGKLAQLAEDLGLSRRSLRRFGVGWSGRDSAWTLPMYDGRGRIIGLTRRFADGSKRIMAGHKPGIYMPVDLPLDLSGLTLVIAEGASDAVAGLDLGYWSVGRFSCNHGAELLIPLVKIRRPSGVVIVADADGPGRRGTEGLVKALLSYTRSLRVITPPEPHKDVRAWVQAGATRDGLSDQIGLTPARRLGLKVVST